MKEKKWEKTKSDDDEYDDDDGGGDHFEKILLFIDDVEQEKSLSYQNIIMSVKGL